MVENIKNEVWKDIPNYEGLYQVSNMGRVKNLKSRKRVSKKVTITYERLVSPSMGDRYLICSLSKDKRQISKYIHKLVISAFVDKPKWAQHVNHINGNRVDNRIENLEWCTAKHNTNHAIKLGLREKCPPNWKAIRQPVMLVSNTKLQTISFATVKEAKKIEPMVENLLRGRTPYSEYSAYYLNK